MSRTRSIRAISTRVKPAPNYYRELCDRLIAERDGVYAEVEAIESAGGDASALRRKAGRLSAKVQWAFNRIAQAQQLKDRNQTRIH